ncbi:MAG: isocitrate/isopropylmalate dehydrogenase family protein [Fusobacteriaceae bacterium]
MYNITLIPGDGIGPEVASATKKVVDSTGVKINWEEVNAGAEVYEKIGSLVPDEVYASIEKNKIALKGPITTPIGKGFRSINVMLRKKYDLYSNVRPSRNFKGIDTPFKNVNMIIFRENTEGLYIGEEKQIDNDTVEAIKRITRKGSTRICREAFVYARKMNKKNISVAHKANILKMTDGLFLECAREVAKDYPEISVKEVIIDNMCMQMVSNPSQFEVIVTMNLYGDILSDLAAGLVGGLGVVPSANIGKDIAIFEAVHGSAPDIAGKNLANPTALILSAVMMLNHIGEKDKAKIIEQSVEEVLAEGKIKTKDLGGNSSTSEYTDEIIKKIKSKL